jgi:hypothetical protein
MDYKDLITDRMRNVVSMRSNTAAWNNISNEKMLSFVVTGQFPPSEIQSLFHEFMHSWCANSPVSRAIQLLWLNYLKESINSPFSRFGVIEGKIPFQAAGIASVEMCLRPIAEGLALFSEYDYCAKPHFPRKHGSILTALAILVSFFNHPDAPRTMDFVVDYVRKTKLDEDAYIRKANLFCQAIGEVNESYLLGYTLVKDIYSIALKQSEGVLDTEFFLKYLRSYIFEDWTLVQILLGNQEPDDRSFVPTVLKHLTKRLERLRLPGLWDEMLKYEKEVLDLGSQNSLDRPKWEALPGLGLSRREIADGQAADEAYRERLHCGDERNKLIDALLSLLVFKHDLLTLFTADVWFALDDRGIAAIYADRPQGHTPPLLGIDGCRQIGARIDRGQVHTYLSYQSGPVTAIHSLTFEDELIAMWAHGLPVEEEYGEEVFRNLGLETAASKALEQVMSIDPIMQAGDVSGELIDDVVNTASKKSAKAYKSILVSLNGIGCELLKFSSAFPQLSSWGMRKLLGGGDFLDAYSLLSLCNSWTDSRAEIGSIFAQRGYQLDSTLKNLETVQKKYGVTLLDDSSSKDRVRVRL